MGARSASRLRHTGCRPNEGRTRQQQQAGPLWYAAFCNLALRAPPVSTPISQSVRRAIFRQCLAPRQAAAPVSGPWPGLPPQTSVHAHLWIPGNVCFWASIRTHFRIRNTAKCLVPRNTSQTRIPPIASTRQEAPTKQVSISTGCPGAGLLALLAPDSTTSASEQRAASVCHAALALFPIGWQPCVGAFWQAAAGPNGQLDAVENFILHPEVCVLSEEGPLKAGST